MARCGNARKTRREQVERLLGSGMRVSEWCALNGVDGKVLYKWLGVFRDEEPEVFGGREIAHAGDGRRFWFEEVRRAMSESKALAKRDGGPPAPAFAVIDSSDLEPPALPGAPRSAPCIGVEIGSVRVSVPAGSAESDAAAVLRAVAAL